MTIEPAMKKFLLITVLIVSLASPAAAQVRMEIFSLKHRSVTEMIPVIRPLLGEEGRVTGMRNQLVVRATPENLAAVRKLLEKLDTALMNLKITVKQNLGHSLRSRESEIEAAARVSPGIGMGVAPERPGSGGLTVSGDRPGVQARGRMVEKGSAEDEIHTQQVITLEGRPAVIYFTRSIPFTKTESVDFGDKSLLRQSVEYRKMTTGLSILPRLQGNQVVLEVSPVAARAGREGLETQGVETTVTGRLGEWIELGGMSLNSGAVDTGIAAGSRFEESENHRIFLKVEKQP
ncbi:MAG: secretin N-terminal domain-containing protein [Nitrospinaceae bacterium]